MAFNRRKDHFKWIRLCRVMAQSKFSESRLPFYIYIYFLSSRQDPHYLGSRIPSLHSTDYRTSKSSSPPGVAHRIRASHVLSSLLRRLSALAVSGSHRTQQFLYSLLRRLSALAVSGSHRRSMQLPACPLLAWPALWHMSLGTP